MADEQINVNAIPDVKAFFKEPTIVREEGASWVAKGLVYIFGGAVFVCAVGGLLLVGLHPPMTNSAGGKENVVVDAVLPLLQGVGSFAVTVFGPLLAFVLGYYFGEKKQAAS
jgi:hypothetical protein